MKRICAAILALSVLLCACGSSPVSKLKKLSEAEIVLIDWGSEPLVKTSDGDTLTHVCENLMSLGLKEMKNTEPTPLLYSLEFFNASEQPLLTISISEAGWISIEG